MRPSITAAEQAITTLRQQFANAKDGWDFDEDGFFGSGSFVQELKETAVRLGVRIYEQDERIYCYPSLVRVLASDRVVEIDKKREPRLRPTVLVNLLKDRQRRPPRSKPEPFLEALFDAYGVLVPKEGRTSANLFGAGTVIKLLDVYRLLTLLPGQSKEYSRPEFARDIYLLDQSGVTVSKAGYTVSFPVGTGTRAPANTIFRIVTQEGREKLYYGIAFSAAQ
ncbi:MAG: hypothetical protein HW416_2150 [Chloroflexi bacterium]|nr:hypothetical protein [Chloroflexota bacterium]